LIFGKESSFGSPAAFTAIDHLWPIFSPFFSPDKRCWQAGQIFSVDAAFSFSYCREKIVQAADLSAEPEKPLCLKNIQTKLTKSVFILNQLHESVKWRKTGK